MKQPLSAPDENGTEEEIVPDEEFSVRGGSAFGGEENDAAEKVKKLKDELKKCDAEKKEYLDGWQRAKADYANYRKDEARRFEDMARFVAAGLIEDLLPVLDSFDLALSHPLPKEAEHGMLLIRSQIGEVMKKRGVEEISVKSGEPFNPELHESIGEVAAEYPAGTIAEVAQKGYMLRGKVLRPVRVRIVKAGE